MADIDYFLKRRWTVTSLPRVLDGLLPAKGCTVRFERNPSSKTLCLVATDKSKAKWRFDGFQYKGGRLELPLSDPDKVLVVDGRPVRGRARLKGWIEVDGKNMQGTWGAESGSGSGSGGGGGGTGSKTYTTAASADAA